MAQLGDALQRAAVAMSPRCPTICTTCFHMILKSALPAPEPTPSVPAQDQTASPPTIPPSSATGHAPSGSRDNGSTPGSPNNVPPRPRLKTQMESLHLCTDKSSRPASPVSAQFSPQFHAHVLLFPNVFTWWSTCADQDAHREGCRFCICLGLKVVMTKIPQQYSSSPQERRLVHHWCSGRFRRHQVV